MLYLSYLLLALASGLSYAIPIAVLVLACRLWGARDLRSIFWVTLAYFFLVPPLADTLAGASPRPGWIMQARFDGNYLDDWLVKLLALLLRLAVARMFYLAVQGLSAGHKLLALHAGWFGLVFVCDAHFSSYLPARFGVNVTMLFLVSFSWAFYYLCYLSLERPATRWMDFLPLAQGPFFEKSMVPRPVVDLAPTGGLEARCTRTALTGAGVLFLGHLLDTLICGKELYDFPVLLPYRPLPDFLATGLTLKLFAVYSRLELWGAVLWNGFRLLTVFFGISFLIECSYLMLGYDVPRRIGNPARAHTLGEFFNAIIPYYVILIHRMYLYPFYTHLRRRGWHKTTAFNVAAGFAVIGGGLLTHMVRDVYLAGLVGAGPYLYRYLVAGTPYFALIFLGVSTVRLPRGTPVWLRFPVLLTVYSFIFVSRVDGLFVPWGERWRFALALFGASP